MNVRLPLAVGLLTAGLCLAAAAVRAQGSDDVVESGRQSLSGRGGFPWYDAAEDRLRRIEVAPSPPPPRPGDWEWQPSAPQARAGGRSGFWRVLEILAYVLLAVLLLAVLYLLRRAMVRGDARRRTAREMEGGEVEVDRIEQLPFSVRRPDADLLSEARRCYEAGNYDEAIIYFFSYQLVQLDKGQFLRLARGKTNRQYLREVRSEPEIHALLEDSMVAFEEVYFGNRRLSRQRFEACWQRLDRFHHLVLEESAA